MGLLSFLLPRDSRFFPLFAGVAGHLREANQAVDAFLAAESPERRSEVAARIKELETKNDDLTHRIYEALHQTFLTPFDREDLFQLASTLDDVLDVLTATVERCSLFGVAELTPEMRELMQIQNRAMGVLAGLVERLGDLKKPGAFDDGIKEIHSLENDGDQAYHRALTTLFRNGRDPVDVIRWKDLYQIIESAIDCCENAVNVIEGIAIKHA